ncbi:MAG: molybdopterin-synthase adenylyltransferase MoeB [Actinobacteria bacterium]|nr:molybdopterin-synthase adenylyltransferase MoeB [Actinomycetota bacterium]MBM3697323.1 molybdopterin-synthase adenylyltransferase MoeB [Actinomycetota bacterium]
MSPSYQDLLATAREVIPEVEPSEVAPRVQAGDGPLVIDVRETAEWDQGHLPGAVHIPRGFLESRVAGAAGNLEQELLISCASGQRSLLAAKTLADMGYSNVTSLAGGFARWKQNNYPVEVPRTLSPAQRSRYSRHVLIPEVGEEGQLTLLDSKALLIGAGGLGSPAAYYLAAAGVGTIGLVDDDEVDESNLQRQIIHTTERVGMNKGESAREAIRALNPEVQVNVHPFRVNRDNVLDLLEEYDVVVDGADNFPTRYLLADASLMTRTPLVHASILRFEGHASVFNPYEGPCYRCLFPEPPPPDLAPSCGEAGVLGVLCGVMGNIQATEAIKVLLGMGDTLAGRLLIYDALGMTFTELKVRRDPDCPSCGPNADLQLRDYEAWCAGMGSHDHVGAAA